MKLFALVAILAAAISLSLPAQGRAQSVERYSSGTTQVPVSPQTPLPVGQATMASASFTTPVGVVGYAVGNLIANSATAGSVVPMAFTVCRDTSGTSGMVRRAHIKTQDTGFAAATVRLHLYRASPTAANGDHAAWSTSESLWIGDMDVTLDHVFTDPVEKGNGAPAVGSEISYQCAAGVQTIYGLLEARSAATPQGAKVWTATLEAWPN